MLRPVATTLCRFVQVPLASLAAGRDKIRTLKQAQGLPAGGVTVYLRGGTYILREPFAPCGKTPAPPISRSPTPPSPAAKVTVLGGSAIRGESFTAIKDPAIRQRNPPPRQKVVQVNLGQLGITGYAPFDGLGHYSIHEVKPASALYFDDKPMTLAVAERSL